MSLTIKVEFFGAAKERTSETSVATADFSSSRGFYRGADESFGKNEGLDGTSQFRPIQRFISSRVKYVQGEKERREREGRSGSLFFTRKRDPFVDRRAKNRAGSALERDPFSQKIDEKSGPRIIWRHSTFQRHVSRADS